MITNNLLMDSKCCEYKMAHQPSVIWWISGCTMFNTVMNWYTQVLGVPI